MRVLLTEDNRELADITAFNLKKYGFAVDTVYSGEEALRLLEGNGEYDVIILDLILPDIDGIRLLQDLKLLVPDVPILALTAKDTEEDRVYGIQIGFDDYMTKPFSHHELAARLRVLYRSRRQQHAEIIETGPLQIHPESQAVFKDGVPVKLTLNEFRVLHYLAKNKSRKVSIEELLKSIWDMNSTTRRAKVITTVSRLRKKIGDHRKKIIKTCKGGYIVEGSNV